MGKRLIQQRRGRGSKTYTSPSFRFKGEVRHPSADAEGTVVDLVHCGGHSAPLMLVSYLAGQKQQQLAFASEGVSVGDRVAVGSAAEVKNGHVLPLQQIPEGTLIHNIELRPGDGGKLVRSSGSFAKVIARSEKDVRVLLPSRKEKLFSPDCRASIGTIAGSGRTEKPFLKAGTRYLKMRVRNKLYPHVCGISMNAVDHPFGGKCSHIKGRPTQSPRNAPPGRKVGKIAPRRTGRKR
ncbi:50S ribosomal protein L2 [Candidatus Woesearchaeota archaeon]|nr:50S ribosomal protein L2 [Candidatus Woesearchaeota archaeon]